MQHRSQYRAPPTIDGISIASLRLFYNPTTGKHGPAGRTERFIRGPIPFLWMQRANELPGKAGTVGLSLWFLKGVKQSDTFAVTSEAKALAGCGRHAFARGLKALADAGLVTVQARPGAHPVVTVQGKLQHGT